MTGTVKHPMTENKLPEDFETALAQLEQIVDAMEGGSLSLEDSLDVYQRGVDLVKVCQTRLQHVEQQIKVLDGSLLQNYDGKE